MKLTLATASFLILCTAASAQTPPTAAPASGGREACKAAIEKICPGVKPGDGRIKACLKQNNTSIEQVCPGAGKHHGGKGGASSGTSTPSPVAQPPAGQ